jgi:hypothetical protein
MVFTHRVSWCIKQWYVVSWFPVFFTSLVIGQDTPLFFRPYLEFHSSSVHPSSFCIGLVYQDFAVLSWLPLYDSAPVVVPFIGIKAANSGYAELHVDSTNEVASRALSLTSVL